MVLNMSTGLSYPCLDGGVRNQNCCTLLAQLSASLSAALERDMVFCKLNGRDDGICLTYGLSQGVPLYSKFLM